MTNVETTFQNHQHTMKFDYCKTLNTGMPFVSQVLLSQVESQHNQVQITLIPTVN